MAKYRPNPLVQEGSQSWQQYLGNAEDGVCFHDQLFLVQPIVHFSCFLLQTFLLFVDCYLVGSF